MKNEAVAAGWSSKTVVMHVPCADFVVVRINPLCFLARCCKRRLNQAWSVCHICVIWHVFIVLLFIRAPFMYCQFSLVCVLSFSCSG